MFERFEQFSVAISEISHYWHKITTVEMEKVSLKGPHSIYLTAMARFPQGITANQLCEVCSKDKSDVSRMMQIMEKQGLVVKQGGHHNQYKGVFQLTPQGRDVAAYVQKRASLAVSISGKDLSDDERRTLYHALASIADNLRHICEKGLPQDE